VTSVTDPLGHASTFTYDPDGNLLAATDENQHTITYTYDAANQLTLVTRADNSTRGFGYDVNGDVTQVQDGLHQATNVSYDPMGRPISLTDPLNRTTAYGYDPAGRITSVTDAMGRTTSLAYDAGGELVSESYSDGITPNAHYSYDAIGRPTSMSDGTGTSTFGYDSLHRLVQTTNGAGSAVGYGYDLNGNLTSITYPGSARVVNKTYDAAGRLATVGDWLANTTTYKYDANSNPIEADYPNGVIAKFTYDNTDQLTSLSDALAGNSFLNLTYSRDNLGQITAESSKTFGYDTIDRLTSAQIAGNQTTFSYDTADRLTQVQVAGGSTSTYAYDAADQLQTLTTTAPGGAQIQKYTYAYDQNGNRISRTDQSSNSLSYVYDQANRLTSLGSAAQYSYDGFGLRTQKNVAGVVTNYTWNIVQGLPTVILDGQTAYVTGLGGLPLEQITPSGQVYYYHSDQQGSTRAMTDSSGAVVQTYDYDAYGNPATTSGSVVNPFQYSGQYTDAESGLQYLRARYYDPSSESFISRDPAVLLEPYSYAGASPQMQGDPSGLDWADATRAVVDESNGYLGYVPYIGTPLELIAAYSALRHCDFAAASEYMSVIAINLITGVAAGVLGPLVGGVAKADAKAARAGEAAAERAAVRGESKAADATVAYTKKELKAARQRAVRQAWKDERALINAGQRGTRDWSDAEKAELLRTGKVKGYVGHHINSVKGHPEMAGDPNNIEFVTPAEHLARHGGNWRNPTVGELLDRSLQAH
jgi:RHS repeat-associated protein